MQYLRGSLGFARIEHWVSLPHVLRVLQRIPRLWPWQDRQKNADPLKKAVSISFVKGILPVIHTSCGNGEGKLGKAN